MVKLLFILFICILFSPSANAEIVTKVLDGDTFITNTGTKVRMLKIDAPELKQKDGNMSKVWLEAYILNKEVELRETKKDMYGRTLAMVYLPHFFTHQFKDATFSVNQHMVWIGQAWAYMVSKKDGIRKLENEARHGKMGLWSSPNPEAPWEYRKRIKNDNKQRKTSGTKTKISVPSGRYKWVSRLAERAYSRLRITI